MRQSALVEYRSRAGIIRRSKDGIVYGKNGLRNIRHIRRYQKPPHIAKPRHPPAQVAAIAVRRSLQFFHPTVAAAKSPIANDALVNFRLTAAPTSAPARPIHFNVEM